MLQRLNLRCNGWRSVATCCAALQLAALHDGMHVTHNNAHDNAARHLATVHAVRHLSRCATRHAPCHVQLVVACLGVTCMPCVMLHVTFHIVRNLPCCAQSVISNGTHHLSSRLLRAACPVAMLCATCPSAFRGEQFSEDEVNEMLKEVTGTEPCPRAVMPTRSDSAGGAERGGRRGRALHCLPVGQR